MRYPSLRSCVNDLERHGQLVRVAVEIDPALEAAEIQRRAYAAGAPALYFERLKGTPFPAVSNLFGSMERCRFILRDTLEAVARLVKLKADPTQFWRAPGTFLKTPLVAWTSLPRATRRVPVLAATTTIGALPPIQSWPRDGGPFITLPQVITEEPGRPGPMHTNVGMYRLQLAGNAYAQGREVGLHCQIHRGLGVHLAKAKERGERLKVTVAVGGPPAHAVAAVMPLPEGLTELLFAGMLGGRRFRYARHRGHLISADADFCIVGEVDPERTLPEGPFGDHLGYYSLAHPFPVLEVAGVYHRRDPIWPFTVVGRPPQEDTTFGQLVHELTAPLVPVELPGVHDMHAVDAAGVHPLMLAVGSERYVPHGERTPQELLTIANAILGFGQASLAKYLMIVAREDAPGLSSRDVERFLGHLLERVDWRRDLHFQTRTTIDTLDYTGTGLNQGSKLVIAAAGEPRRTLARATPAHLSLPPDYEGARLALPGVLVAGGPRFEDADGAAADIRRLCEALNGTAAGALAGPAALALVVVVDDAEFAARTLGNFLWVTFTRSNPSHDVHGVRSFIEHKHWGCEGPLVIDARLKPHHAPPLVEDPEITRRVDRLAAPGGPLHGVIP